MKHRTGIMALVACSLLAVMLATSCIQVSTGAEGQPRGIQVTGEGKVTATPDLAIIRLGVEARERSVEEAQRRAASAMSRVSEAIKGLGVPEKDIRTQRFQILPERRVVSKERGEEILEYRVTNVVVVNLRDLDKTARLVDMAAERGGDLVRVESVQFQVEDPSRYKAEAQEQALKDARTKAEAIAAQLGRRLGKPRYVSESAFRAPTFEIAAPQVMGRGGEPTPTPIEPGQTEIRLSVQVVFEIE